MGIEANKILPSIHFANSEVKRILTTCCINTAARILTSKAAAHSSGSLSQSVDSTLDFARQNGLTLPKEIIESLRNCQVEGSSSCLKEISCCPEEVVFFSSHVFAALNCEHVPILCSRVIWTAMIIELSLSIQ